VFVVQAQKTIRGGNFVTEEERQADEQAARAAVLKAQQALETLRRARVALEQINQELTTHVND
jgi:hypothetical protein